MATHATQGHVAPPTASIAVAPAPAPSVSRTDSPSGPRTVLDTAVPVIRPYLIAAFHGAAAVAATFDAVRSFPAAQAAGVGVLSSADWWQLSLPAGAGGVGTAGARIGIKSGKVLLPAALSGTGTSTATADVGTGVSGGSEGTAAVTMSIISSAVALFDSEGRYSALSPLTSDGTGRGELTAAAGLVGAVVMPVAHASSGTLLAAAPVGANVPTSGEGTLAQSMVVASLADHTGSGELAAINTAKATAAAGSTGSGTLSVNAKTPFSPTSMTKNGLWDSLDTTFRTITGWIPAATGYPGSRVSNDALVAQWPKTAAALSASIVFTGGGQFTSSTVTLQLMVNGVSVATSGPKNVGGEGTATLSVSKTRDIAVGDLITVQARADSTLYPPTVNTNSASYVRIA
ncbi:hypothetical protein OG203_27000 [Nocardia sp. NBC_01499]|uniref:hypothetical protein n=1 Tax=Nocardia sp. NBC_01499 TaxID=2903597 RepID=UPI003869317A